MYENNNTVSIDWKGLFIKLIVVALIIFAIFKGFEYLSNNKKSNPNTTSTATQLFNANLESLRQAGENYYDFSNYPKNGQTVMVTLAELTTKGDIKELYDEQGNECNRENSYVSVTNDNGQYKLKATLSCGEITNYTVVMIGCECEGSECDQAIKKLEKENNVSNSSTTSNKTNNGISNNSKNNSKKEEKPAIKEEKPSKNESKPVIKEEKPSKNESKPVIKEEKPSKENINKEPVKENLKKEETTKKTYTVKFDTNSDDYIESQIVEKYETAEEPIEPERDDSRFMGWYYKGEKWDFDEVVTKDMTLEAYYWETKDDVTTTVYSAGWDTYGTTYFTVTHKLAIPQVLQNDNIKNVRIKYIRNVRSMNPYSYDLYYHGLYHRTTYDGYRYTTNTNTNTGIDNGTLGNIYNISVRKTYANTYDRWVTWSGNVGNQCANTFDGYNCNYGIVYNVTWEYDQFTD